MRFVALQAEDKDIRLLVYFYSFSPNAGPLVSHAVLL